MTKCTNNMMRCEMEEEIESLRQQVRELSELLDCVKSERDSAIRHGQREKLLEALNLFSPNDTFQDLSDKFRRMADGLKD